VKAKGMGLMVKTTARLATAFILVFGFYVLVSSHHMPGGGFAFGVVAALAMMLVLLAFGRDVAVTFIPRAAVAVAGVVAVIGLLVVGFLGYLPAADGAPGTFLRNFLPMGDNGGVLSGGTVWLMDLCIGVMLGAYVFAMLTALSTFHSRQRNDPAEPKGE
jgi:multisubunit Na+/H+ antiporter MnhB subunit